MTHEPGEALGAVQLARPGAGGRGSEPVFDRAAWTEPPGIEELLPALGHPHRLERILGDADQHAVDEVEHVAGQRGHLSQLERLLELRRRCRAIPQVQLRLAEPQPRQGLHARRPGLAREP
jgi:hypothetical protein